MWDALLSYLSFFLYLVLHYWSLHFSLQFSGFTSVSLDFCYQLMSHAWLIRNRISILASTSFWLRYHLVATSQPIIGVDLFLFLFLPCWIPLLIIFFSLVQLSILWRGYGEIWLLCQVVCLLVIFFPYAQGRPLL